MCDCTQAKDAIFGDLLKFAGVYCEHQATSYCQKGSSHSEHAFCTNGGECKVMVGRREEHEGCKCPAGYEGHFCQFVRGSRPTDWALTDYMHPALVNAYGGAQTGGTNMNGVIIGTVVGVVVLTCIVLLYLACAFDDLSSRLRRNQKESDTGSQQSSNNNGDSGVVLGGRRTSASPRNASFVGGKSVYKKKTSTGHFVTADSLEADGGVLQDALEDHNGPSMEEVDLDDKPTGEMA